MDTLVKTVTYERSIIERTSTEASGVVSETPPQRQRRISSD